MIGSVGNTKSPNPEANPANTYVSQHIVAVDNRFSGFQCCNFLKCKCCDAPCDDSKTGRKEFKHKAQQTGITMFEARWRPFLQRHGLWHPELNATSCPDWTKQVTTGQSDAAWFSTTTAALKANMYHHVKHVKSIKTGCMIDVMIDYIDKIGNKDCIGTCKQKIPSGGIYNSCLTSCFKDLWCKVPMDSVTETWAMALGTLAGTIAFVASGNKLCVDVAGGFFAPGSIVRLWTCQNSNPDQQFVYRNNMIVWSPMDGSGQDLCLDVTNGKSDPGTPLMIYTCDTANDNQVGCSDLSPRSIHISRACFCPCRNGCGM